MQVLAVEEAATYRLLPMREAEDARKFNEDCH